MARVRRARREDFPGVIAFVPEQINNLLEQLVAHPHGLLLVSEDDGVVTGMFGAVAFPHPISGEITVGELFWWADRRGVGLRLLRAAELWAETRGAQIMQMIAPNARVGQLYQRLGYRQAETLFQRRF
jgi:GNAT superfamily N-acetyltransferase